MCVVYLFAFRKLLVCNDCTVVFVVVHMCVVHACVFVGYAHLSSLTLIWNLYLKEVADADEFFL